jgi:hypothetical protein
MIDSVKSSFRRAGVIVGIAVLAAGIQSLTAQSIGRHVVTNRVGGIDKAEGEAMRPTDLGGALPHAQMHPNNLWSSGSGTFALPNRVGAAYTQ